MLTITWQEEIASLKQDLRKEINKISEHSEINIPNHICINNLKSKLERLDEIEKILSIEKYKIAISPSSDDCGSEARRRILTES